MEAKKSAKKSKKGNQSKKHQQRAVMKIREGGKTRKGRYSEITDMQQSRDENSMLPPKLISIIIIFKCFYICSKWYT